MPDRSNQLPDPSSSSNPDSAQEANQDLGPVPGPDPVAHSGPETELKAGAEADTATEPAVAGAALPAFEAELEHDAETGGVYVVVPRALTAALGLNARARLAVRATFDGYPHPGTLVPLPGAEGLPTEHMLLVPKQVRKAIGKTWTNDVTVTLAPDPEARALELPADLLAALAAVRGSRARFGQLSKAHQREYLAWIESARTPEGRAERLADTAQRMLMGMKKR